jgi:hypothetical protein
MVWLSFEIVFRYLLFQQWNARHPISHIAYWVSRALRAFSDERVDAKSL